MQRNTYWWRSQFAAPQASFTTAYLGLHLRKLSVAVALIAVLWLIKRDRRALFLARGEVDAPIHPVRWLGIGTGQTWRKFGLIFALAAGALVLIPSTLSLRLSSNILLAAVPLLPAAIFFAAINAFSEEVYFRNSLLSTLVEVAGKNHSLWMTMVLFGLIQDDNIWCNEEEVSGQIRAFLIALVEV